MAGGLKSDAERFLPWEEDPVNDYEHLHRYRFAKEFAKNKKVLDLACGEGYGSALLAEVAEKVVGVDIDEFAIQHASAKYVKDNLEFVKSSMTRVAIAEDKHFDVIVCFEALEHICEHDELIEEVRRLLRGNGIFIVSSPNKYSHTDQGYYRENPWHKKELYLDEFETLLSDNFKHHVTYGQRVYLSSHIVPLKNICTAFSEYVIERSDDRFVFVSSEKKEPLYFISICSDVPLQEALASHLIDVTEESRKNFVIIRRIQSSSMLKAISRYYLMRDRIFEPGTKRMRFAKIIWRVIKRSILISRRLFYLCCNRSARKKDIVSEEIKK